MGSAEIQDEFDELKDEIRLLQEERELYWDAFQNASDEIKRLREALEFYASFVGVPPHINVAPYIIDGGKIAAAALKEGK